MWKIIFFVVLFCIFFEEVKGNENHTKIGDYCDFLEDCQSISNSICNSYDVCECKDGYVASLNNSICLPLATKMGDECLISEQCSVIPQGECKGNICVTAQAITNSTGTTKLKEECTEDSQCTTFLIKKVCKNGTCVLALPSSSPNISAFDLFHLGKSCVNDTDCSGEGTTCMNKLCKCKESFVPAQNLKTCLPKAKSLGDSCNETAQCLSLNGSICENEKCTQLQRVLKDFGDKISSLLIGSTCQHDNECKHMNHSLCLENVCQCQENYITSVMSNSCLEKAKKEGDPCSIDKQCEHIKGAVCIQQKCVKPGVVGTKLGNESSGSTNTISRLALAAILFKSTFRLN